MSMNTEITRSVRWSIALSVLMIVAGVLAVAALGVTALLLPMVGLESLTLVLAAYLLVESILEFILSFQLRPLKGSGWLLVDGIITLILAIMIWRTWPASTLWVVGTLVGISMLFSGFARLTIFLAARRAVDAIGQESNVTVPARNDEK